MKSSVSFVFLVICTVVLAAQQSQAKKGCNAYGHACYGGHGKRSLGSLMGGGGSNAVGSSEPDEALLRPDGILQVFPSNDVDDAADAYPKYRLIKIMKSWFGGHPRRQPERMNELDYPVSGEIRENNNNNNGAFN